MDVFTSGPNVGNLLVTCGLVIFLLIASTKAKMLDKSGSQALHCSVWWLVAWDIGRGCSFCSASCSVPTRRQNGVLKKKKELGLSESSDGHRGWTNVVANGAIPGLICIYAYLANDWSSTVWIFGAAVAVAASDTFASEIGCLDPRVRMITNFKPCVQGENGGFSPNGQLAAAVGSFVVAILTYGTWLLTSDTSTDLNGPLLLGVLALTGWIGCQVDSYLGALLENRGYLTKGSVNALAITSGVAIMSLFLSSL